MSALRTARERAGMSQEQAASAIGKEQTEISRWERGRHKPSPETLIRLADLYQCSIDALLGRKEI